jgi:hypothetical protein
VFAFPDLHDETEITFTHCRIHHLRAMRPMKVIAKEKIIVHYAKHLQQPQWERRACDNMQTESTHISI